MLLMEYRNDVEQCNPCAKSREGSWHGSLDAPAAPRLVSHRRSKPSFSGTSGSDDSRSGPSVTANVITEATTSEVLSLGLNGPHTCASDVMTFTVDGGLPATFAGTFKAKQAGAAQAFLSALCTSIKQMMELQRTSKVLKAAFEGLEIPEGCTGSAVLVCNGELLFSVLGHGLVALSHEDTKRSKTELLAGLEQRGPLSGEGEEALDIGKSRPNRRLGFGSIIPVDRSSITQSQGASGIVTGESQLTTSHQFLLISAGPLDEAFTADEATAFVERSRCFSGHAGKSASLLASESHRILTTRRVQDHHVAVAVLHFKPSPEGMAFQPPLSRSGRSYENIFESPWREEPSTTAPLLHTSPSGRRVHFVRPFPPTGEEFGATAFADASKLGSRPGSWEAHLGSVTDSSGLLSCGSMLSRPDMSIPEDTKLPEKSMALQLPPPMLPPIRKAYPSSQQLTVTPEMLSSPSPARKAKIGRAASFNSPNGLWPLPKQRLEEPLVRQSSSTQIGSRSRGGAEGRVRAGLPRVSSTLSVAESAMSRSSTTSLANTPASSRRQSTEEIRTNSEDPAAGGKASPEESWAARRTDPWGGNANQSGRKGHGQSQALRLLQGSVGVCSSGNLASTSAPATLSSNLVHSLTQPLERMTSSGTESVVQSLLSGSSCSSTRAVRRVPVVEDSPQGIRAAASCKFSENRVPWAANPLGQTAADSETSNAFSNAITQDFVRRVFGDLTAQPSSNISGSPSPCSHDSQAIPKARKAHSPASPTPPSWPEVGSAAPEHGLMKSLSTESRQHSGVVFSGGSLSSLSQDAINSLADSVESFSLTDR